MAQDPDSSTPGPSRRRVPSDRLELFPTLSTEVPERTLYEYADLKNLYGQVDIHPVIPYMIKKVPRVYIKEIKWNDRVIHNLNTLAKDAGGYEMEDRIKSWESIANRLSSEKKSNVNLDRRLSYVYDNHYFLAKSSFTFGLRTVSEGTVHLYQVTTRPLHFYFQPRGGNWQFNMSQRILPVGEHRKYCHVILKSNTAYRVRAGTSYILIVSHKAYFSLHVLPDNMNIPFETVDPVEQFRANPQERRRESQYEVPPPTPNMLERPEEPVFRVPQQPYNIPPPTPNLLERHDEQVLQQPEDPPPAYEDLYPIDPELHQEPQHQEPEPQQPEPQQLQPEPQQPEPQQPAICIFSYPLQTQVNVVSPRLIQWFHSLKQTLGPIDFLASLPLERAGHMQTEPIDLSTKSAVQIASTSRPAEQTNEESAVQVASTSRPAEQASEESEAQPSGSTTRPAGLKRRGSTESIKKKNKKRTPSEEKLERLIFPELYNELDEVLEQEHPGTAHVFDELCKSLPII